VRPHCSKAMPLLEVAATNWCVGLIVELCNDVCLLVAPLIGETVVVVACWIVACATGGLYTAVVVGTNTEIIVLVRLVVVHDHQSLGVRQSRLPREASCVMLVKALYGIRSTYGVRLLVDLHVPESHGGLRSQAHQEIRLRNQDQGLPHQEQAQSKNHRAKRSVSRRSLCIRMATLPSSRPRPTSMDRDLDLSSMIRVRRVMLLYRIPSAEDLRTVSIRFHVNLFGSGHTS
jgi:hypothetical protein